MTNVFIYFFVHSYIHSCSSYRNYKKIFPTAPLYKFCQLWHAFWFMWLSICEIISLNNSWMCMANWVNISEDILVDNIFLHCQTAWKHGNPIPILCKLLDGCEPEDRWQDALFYKFIDCFSRLKAWKRNRKKKSITGFFCNEPSAYLSMSFLNTFHQLACHVIY